MGDTDCHYHGNQRYSGNVEYEENESMRYRKKPVEVEAIRWEPFEMLMKDVMNFMGIEGSMAEKGILSMGKYKGELIIKTLEGDMTVSEGDWIIKGIAGEFYPCKHDIFTLTYEPVDEVAEVTSRRHGEISWNDMPRMKVNETVIALLSRKYE